MASVNNKGEFDSEAIKIAMAHAQASYPNESVGFVTKQGYVPLKNVASNPRASFSVARHQVKKYRGQVLAVIHSHPDGPYYPSASDMRGQLDWGVPWGIIYVEKGSPVEPFFWGDSLPIVPLIGRPFQHGITDCYSYVRDWFRLNRNLLLDEFPRDWDWWQGGQDLYTQNFKSQGFYEIQSSDVQKGDCFLAQFGRSAVINHAGVYEGGGLIGHQVGDIRGGYSESLLSRRGPLHLWKSKIRMWLRHD
ncbi:Mov34/MPN/PAD-1 family protein [Teredinibacter purpureus]|uniref:Mov34/MPN/PAD-1 family protein n=1 Tax=Teredinibacter purpureus TaxID=2731756 RepID=UPI000697CBE0|nr:Mov34/MPN/PAD-1 family protein [Teredinibacter purpureus]